MRFVLAVLLISQAQDGVEINLPVQELVLDNGLRVLVVEKPGAPRVHCALYWRVGSVNERPGITGLAQVNGRNALLWEEKFALDVEYVETRSLLLDLKILGLTAIKVVKRDGIAADGESTMPEFLGSARPDDV